MLWHNIWNHTTCCKSAVSHINGEGPDQVQCSVNPDLGQNCLQRLSADVKVATSKERIKLFSIRMVKDTRYRVRLSTILGQCSHNFSVQDFS